jgi:transposase
VLQAAGFDETTFLRKGRQFTTNIVCLDTGVLIDIVKGRSGPVLAGWITNNPDTVSTLSEVVIDPFAGYHRAIIDHLGGVTETVDRFHIERLGTQMVTDVRQRRQQALCGHRGRQGDPLYDARSALSRNWTRLRPREWAHLVAVLDTDQDTITAWNVAQQLADIYRQSINEGHARRSLNTWFQLCAPTVTSPKSSGSQPRSIDGQTSSSTTGTTAEPTPDPKPATSESNKSNAPDAGTATSKTTDSATSGPATDTLNPTSQAR